MDLTQSLWPIIGFILVLLTAAGMVLFSLKKMRTRFPPVFRKIPSITRLRKAIGLSVEDGSRIHVALGNANLTDPASASGLSALSTLHRLGQLTSTSDQPPIATSGDGGISILSRDVLKIVSVETNSRELYEPDHGLLTGPTPFSYVIGALDIIEDPGIRTNILLGNFGPEVGFLTTRSEDKGIFCLAASNSIVAQSVFLATLRDVLIGEELFAIPAYLAFTPIHLASVRVQDYLRLLVGVSLVAGAFLKLLGIV
jgi:hypothetical protein